MIPDFPIDIRIRLAELKKKLWLLDFANFLPCWLSQQNWASQQGRKLAKSGSNNFFFNSANLILMSIGKSGIIKFEFQKTQVSWCSSSYTPKIQGYIFFSIIHSEKNFRGERIKMTLLEIDFINMGQNKFLIWT